MVPGEDGLLPVVYTAPDYSTHSATLTLTTNDPNAESIEVPLTGTADPDQDGDGFDAVLVGGDDCDDADPTRNPGVAEIWYDGIDQDCDGASDYDADRDGYMVPVISFPN